MLFLITLTLFLFICLCVVTYWWQSAHLRTLELKAALANAREDHEEWLARLPRVHPDVERKLREAQSETSILRHQLHHAQVILASLQEVPPEELQAIEHAMTTLQTNLYRIRHRILLPTTRNSLEYYNAMRGYKPAKNDPAYTPSNLNTPTVEP